MDLNHYYQPKQLESTPMHQQMLSLHTNQLKKSYPLPYEWQGNMLSLLIHLHIQSDYPLQDF